MSTRQLQEVYDFIVCGSGSSGSVVAGRLSENPNVSVLLVEAGGDDNVDAVLNPGLWPSNWGTERDWNFVSQPERGLHGRSLPMTMGKVLGGGSSINAMIWSRGHKNDWNFFASEAGDSAWNYESVLKIYRRIEDWHGSPDPEYRGIGGPIFVQPAPWPSALALAMLEGARNLGIPTFGSPNGSMMEGEGGCSLVDLRLRDNQRLSVYRSYVFPYKDRPNLTVLANAQVTRLHCEGKRTTGVAISCAGRQLFIRSGLEIVLFLGAINTPKVLMQSGIGDEQELKRFGIPVVQHLQGVGKNLQDHLIVAGCIWESKEPLEVRNNAGEATFFWKSDSSLDTPDLQPLQLEVPLTTPQLAHIEPPERSWTILPGLVRPKSHGQLRLTGAGPFDPVEIELNAFSDPDDMRAMLSCVELCRDIGNSSALRPFVNREVMPGGLRGVALEEFIRDATVTYRHQTCTAKMGRDAMAVVDSNLAAYGIEGLRIADGSIMPRVPTGNTMAPCVIVGERCGEILQNKYGL